jgi:hypothetical protein
MRDHVEPLWPEPATIEVIEFNEGIELRLLMMKGESYVARSYQW